MGLLVEGEWKDRWYDTKANGGRFKRQESSFRKAISRAADAEHPAVAGRYHLYVSYACPWAHRTLIYRALHGLEDALGVTVVDPDMLEHGWVLPESDPGPVEGIGLLHELYTRADPGYSGRVTVPALWDLERGTIVSNESSEIIRMLEEELAPAVHGEAKITLRREQDHAAIDAFNARIYTDINNGVYRAGFATTQEAYDEAVTELFAALDWLEGELEGRAFLCGDHLSEADVRLFTTLVRFDPVYHLHFKCSRRRLRDYPRLWALTRRVYQTPGVAETVRMDHIRRHYFYSHESINPHRIVPLEPEIDFLAPIEEVG